MSQDEGVMERDLSTRANFLKKMHHRMIISQQTPEQGSLRSLPKIIYSKCLDFKIIVSVNQSWFL